LSQKNLIIELAIFKKEHPVPIDLLLYIIIAVVLVLWLRNTIGSRHGSEQDRSDILNQIRERQEKQANADSGKIIDITDRVQSLDKMDETKLLEGLTIEGGSETNQEILAFIKSDYSFDPKAFINGAKEAFPMIVEAFAKGDLKTLKMLLSEGVYTAFEQAIEERKIKGETITTDVHAVKECRIMGIKKINYMTFIKLRFIAEETVVTKDRDGNIISGHPDKIIAMNDVWTFGRENRSSDPTWYLYETSDDVPEEFKNPLPDSN
jgi:predicted lipid-binding transport protein (Tim44 family)